MRTNRIVSWMLAAGLVAGVVHAQPEVYGPTGGPGDPYGDYADDWGDPYDGYDESAYDEYAPEYEERSQAAVEVGFFYGALSPYGEWVRHPYYGWVWFPRNVRAGWRPYSVGRWVMSEYGWTWVSYERFGWATYHYGRWAWDRYVGWLWVPGTDWAPAWVSWQQGNGYIGWAPLPPAVGFDLRAGIRLGGFSLSFGIAPRNYAFVEERRFLDNRVGSYIVPEARNVTIIHNTTNVTQYTVENNRVINRGVPVERVERAAGRKARRMRVAASSAPSTTQIDKDVVRIYRPPESNLRTVKVAERNNAGLRRVSKPPREPRAENPGSAKSPRVQEPKRVPVAPRVPAAPPTVNERRFDRERQQLEENQRKERDALLQMQRREKAPAAKAQDVEKRHAAELAEQKVLRERSAEQLKARQELQRRAAAATAAEKSKRQGQAQAPPPKAKQGGKSKPAAGDAKRSKRPEQEEPEKKPPSGA